MRDRLSNMSCLRRQHAISIPHSHCARAARHTILCGAVSKLRLWRTSFMKIRISTIAPQGLKVKDKLPLDALNARMQEGSGNNILFTAAPEVELTMFRTGNGAESKGTIKTAYRQPCSRCMDEIERTVELPANFLLAPRPADKDESYEDDVGISYYEGDHVDLEDLIQETLILSLDQFWHPPVDESGCCQHCHRNFNAELKNEPEKPATLGALLEQAKRK